MNLTILAGYLGNDPELTYNAKGTAKLSLRLATSSMRPEGEDWKEHTEWHNVIMWGKRGESLAQALCKGRFVVFMGSNTTSSWDDPTNGKKRYKTEVVIGPSHTVTLGPDPRKRDGDGNQHPAEQDGREVPAARPANNTQPARRSPTQTNQGRGRG